MRIALYGNINNTFYQVAKVLRSQLGWDVDLYLGENEPEINFPETSDPELAGRYPSWIKKGRFYGVMSLLAPWRSPLAKALREYDLVIVSHFGPVFAQFRAGPWCFFATGGDLVFLPFPIWSHFRYRRLQTKAAMLLLGWWHRRGLRRVTEVWTQAFFPFVNAIHRLGLRNDQVSDTYVPVILHTERFRYDPTARASGDPLVRRIVDTFDFVLFHPSRIMINDHPKMRATGQWKQNDLLIRAFAKFVERTPAARPVLVIPDRHYSPDLATAKALVADLGIERNVIWAKPPQGHGFTQPELVQLYSVSDVVADDFGIGWFGGVVLEGLAMEKPVLSYVDEAAMARLYPWHPIISTDTMEGVVQELTRLYLDPAFRKSQGELGRRWIEEFHSLEAVARVFERHVPEVLGRPK